MDRLFSDLTASPDQQQDEAALREVGETLLSIAAAHDRCVRALAEARDREADPLVVRALEEASAELAEVRRKLHQSTYLRSAQQRML
jgi:hypothetical protein